MPHFLARNGAQRRLKRALTAGDGCAYVLRVCVYGIEAKRVFIVGVR